MVTLSRIVCSTYQFYGTSCFEVAVLCAHQLLGYAHYLLLNPLSTNSDITCMDGKVVTSPGSKWNIINYTDTQSWHDLNEASLRHFLWYYTSGLYLKLNLLTCVHLRWLLKTYVFLQKEMLYCSERPQDLYNTWTYLNKGRNHRTFYSKYKFFGSEIRYFYYCCLKVSITQLFVLPLDKMEEN